MLYAFESIAALCASLFAGAALYINVAEHPARMGLDTRAAVLQWAASYKRATWLQAPLALVSSISGVAAWFLGADGVWLLGAVLIGAVVPFTLIGIMPTNRKLMESGAGLDSSETRILLERWGNLHAVRTILSMVAAFIYLWLVRGA